MLERNEEMLWPSTGESTLLFERLFPKMWRGRRVKQFERAVSYHVKIYFALQIGGPPKRPAAARSNPNSPSSQPRNCDLNGVYFIV
jgi:hypothetical protein